MVVVQEPTIFGPYATLIAQILALSALASIGIKIAQWLAQHRQMPRDQVFFIGIIAAVIGMQFIALAIADGQNRALTQLEQRQLLLQNQTLANQHLAQQSYQTLLKFKAQRLNAT